MLGCGQRWEAWPVQGAQSVVSAGRGGAAAGQALRGGAYSTHCCSAVHLIAAAEDEAGLSVVHPAKHRPERCLDRSTLLL